tara:strand:+ start:301 stop:462 length:162 start_codon:yes stop_codon:yes gene_type:complete
MYVNEADCKIQQDGYLGGGIDTFVVVGLIGVLYIAYQRQVREHRAADKFFQPK